MEKRDRNDRNSIISCRTPNLYDNRPQDMDARSGQTARKARPFGWLPAGLLRMAPFLLLLLATACIPACGRQDPSADAGIQSPEASQEDTSMPEGSAPDADVNVPSDPAFAEIPNMPDGKAGNWSREIQVSNPGQGYFYNGEGPADSPDALQLELLTEKPNAITDVEDWFDANGLPDLTVPVPNPDWNEAGNLPSHIPETLDNGLRIIQLGTDESYEYALYGEQFWDAYVLCIYDRSALSLLSTLDFSAYRHGTQESGLEQRIWWARVCDDMLVFSVGHGTYADSMPYHAYLAAVSLADGSLLWKSEPLVSNAYNFEIIEDEILSGYGFTAEDDYVYQLDLHTGRILNQLPVKSKPDYLIRLGDTLYVRTYNTNYTFRISGFEDGMQEAPSAPPNIALTDALSSTLNLFELCPSSYTWTHLQEEEAVSSVACGIHPLDYPFEDQTLTLPHYNGMDSVSYYLSCDIQPDLILLRAWDSADAGSDQNGEAEPLSIQIQENFLPLVPNRIYEATLVWEDEKLQERCFCGNASYIFATK